MATRVREGSVVFSDFTRGEWDIGKRVAEERLAALLGLARTAPRK
jgi:hypothetical protein